MVSTRKIWPGFILAVVFLALPLAAVVYFKRCANDQGALAAARNEIAELRAQIALQTQVLSELRSQSHEVQDELALLKPAFASPSGSAAPLLLTELNRRLSEVAAEQSNLLAAIQRLVPHELILVSQEQARQRGEATIRELESQYAEHQKKIEDAQTEVDTLRTNLAVPDEMAVMDHGKAADDPRLSVYRAYFEAKRKRDELRRFGQILGMKLASEKIDLSLPRSK